MSQGILTKTAQEAKFTKLNDDYNDGSKLHDAKSYVCARLTLALGDQESPYLATLACLRELQQWEDWDFALQGRKLATAIESLKETIYHSLCLFYVNGLRTINFNILTYIASQYPQLFSQTIRTVTDISSLYVPEELESQGFFYRLASGEGKPLSEVLKKLEKKPNLALSIFCDKALSPLDTFNQNNRVVLSKFVHKMPDEYQKTIRKFAVERFEHQPRIARIFSKEEMDATCAAMYKANNATAL